MSARATVRPGNYPDAMNTHWDLSSGWHAPRPKGWSKGVEYEYRELISDLTSPDGTRHKVRYYKTEDVGNFSAKTGKDAEKLIADAERAFNSKEAVIETDGCGHIAYLKYAVDSSILEVTFENGSKCLYDKLPKDVCFTLIHAAQTKTTVGVHQKGSSKRGLPRHLLGVLFWDYVRIRGHHHGTDAKYPFTYSRQIDGKYINASSRHLVKMSRENALAILGPRALDRLVAAGMGPHMANRLVNVFLNDEEYIKYSEELGQKIQENIVAEAGAEYRVKSADELADETHKGIKKGKKQGYEQYRVDNLKIADSEMARMHHAGGMSVESEVTDNLRRNLIDQIEAAREDPSYKAWYKDKLKAARGNVKGDIARTDKVFFASHPAVLSAIDLRNNGEIKRSIMESNKLTDVLKHYPKDFQKKKRSQYNAMFPASVAGKYSGLVWSKQMLKDFIPNVDARHRAVYKAMIDSENYRGAFNFLKNNRHVVEYDRGKKRGVGEKRVGAGEACAPVRKLVYYISRYSTFDDKED